MIVLGLTGSIGMGKSTASQMLRKIGCPVHDSDEAVHKALAPYGDAFEIVAVTFPEAWDKKRRLIDRKILGSIVFNDIGKRKELEAILHPIARHSQMKFIHEMKRKGRKIVALDIPLLFEIGAQDRVDYTICVTAPDAIQRRRVLSRPGMTEDKFEAIKALQMPDGQKQALADYVVQTGLGYALTYRQLKAIVDTVKNGRKTNA
jgi:dephospho-CoA kinase